MLFLFLSLSLPKREKRLKIWCCKLLFPVKINTHGLMHYIYIYIYINGGKKRCWMSCLKNSPTFFDVYNRMSQVAHPVVLGQRLRFSSILRRLITLTPRSSRERTVGKLTWPLADENFCWRSETASINFLVVKKKEKDWKATNMNTAIKVDGL